MGVSKNNGIPKSSILIGFSIINHPFWGAPIFGNFHIDSDRMGMSEYVISTEESTIVFVKSILVMCEKVGISVKKVTRCLFGPDLNLVKIGSSQEVNSHYKPPSRVSIPCWHAFLHPGFKRVTFKVSTK